MAVIVLVAHLNAGIHFTGVNEVSTAASIWTHHALVADTTALETIDVRVTIAPDSDARLDLPGIKAVTIKALTDVTVDTALSHALGAQHEPR
jgi:hypothetical protein